MKPSEVKLADYAEGMSLLLRSGVFEVLKQRGKVGLVGASNSNYSELHIAELNRSFGYNQALDELIYYRETFLQAPAAAKPLADYGGVKSLLEKGIISKEEAHGLRKQPASTTDNI